MTQHRVGIVTGGARGLGLAMVRALLDQDVVDRVAVFDLLDDPIDDEAITGNSSDIDFGVHTSVVWDDDLADDELCGDGAVSRA